MIETIKEDNFETGSAILLVGMLYLCEVRKLFETLSERDISGNYIVRNKGRPLVEQCGGEGEGMQSGSGTPRLGIFLLSGDSKTAKWRRSGRTRNALGTLRF